MKRILVPMLLALLAGIVIAGESVTVGTNSVIVLPRRSSRRFPAWVGNTNSYAIGQYVSYRGVNYVVTTAGTATNTAPTHASGISSYDGVGYRHIKPGVRKGATIVNDSTNVVYLAIDGVAVANKGIRLNANGGTANIDADDNCEVQAIAGATNNNVTVQDR